jgi:hypothetical protein
MIDPDDVLDWLEEHQRQAEASDIAIRNPGDVIQELIDDFNQQWDTRDSPLPDPMFRTQKKPKKKRHKADPPEDFYPMEHEVR